MFNKFIKKIFLENKFGFIAYLITTFIIILLNLFFLSSVIFEQDYIFEFIDKIYLNKIFSAYFFISLLYLGVITLEKIFMPVEEILKEKIINEKNYIEISRKKFIFWVWFAIIVINFLIYFIGFYKNKVINIDITQIIFYFYIVAGIFIFAQNLSPFLKNIKSPLENNETEDNETENNNEDNNENNNKKKLFN